MGKLLKLKDGTEYTATIASTVTDVQIPVENYKGVDTIKAKMTVKNLAEVEFDGRKYTELSLVDEKAYRAGDRIIAEFQLHLGLEDRIEAERQAAVDAYTLQLIEEGLL